MPVRSKRLAGPTGLAAGTTTVLYTAPVGETVLVKWVTAVASSVDVLVILRVVIGGVGAAILARTAPVNNSLSLESWFVLQPGEQVSAQVGSAGGATVALFGAELEGVAD